jgi:hypothetical protein
MLPRRFLGAKPTTPLIVAFVIGMAAMGTGLVHLLKNASSPVKQQGDLNPLPLVGPGNLPPGNYPAGSLAVGNTAPLIEAKGWLNGPFPASGAEPKLTVVDICAIW